MLIGELMERNVTTCRPEDSLSRAAKLMWASDCGTLPVVDGAGRIVAILTDRDLCMASCGRGLSPETTPVSRVARHHVVTVREDESAETAEDLMRTYQVRRLPVVDRAGRPVGILSLYDLARQAHWAGSRGDRLTTESVVATEIAIGGRSRRG
jgi:CBS domain-containing protein